MKGALFILVFVAGVVAPLRCLGISRVGNGTLKSEESLYSTRSPEYFKPNNIVDGNRVSFSGLVPVPGNRRFGGFDFIEVLEFGESYPYFKNLDRESIVSFFIRNGWSVEDHQLGQCVDSFTIENQESLTQVVFWGYERGAVIVSSRGQISQRGTKNIIDNIQLEPGACQWRP